VAAAVHRRHRLEYSRGREHTELGCLTMARMGPTAGRSRELRP
jgi:hypothetical protein